MNVFDTPLRSGIVSEELKHLAFENHHSHAFFAWLKLTDASRLEAFLEKYVFRSVCEYAGEYIQQLTNVSAEAAREFAQLLTDSAVKTAERIRSGNFGFSQEWFQGLDLLSQSLVNTHMLEQARTVLDLAERTGSIRFPGNAQSLAITVAYLDSILGDLKSAEQVSLKFVKKPYIMPSRSDRPRMYWRLLPILIKCGHIQEYREVLWRGLTSFYTDSVLRNSFSEKAKVTYRGFWRTLFFSDAPLSGRFIFLFHEITRAIGGVPALKWIGMYRLASSLLLAQLYVLNYLTHKRPYWLRQSRKERFGFRWGRSSNKILVTRAMGGIGDFLMMTPGLIALKKKYPQKEIHFAIPKSFFPLFEGISEFKCIDIYAEDPRLSEYFRWADLTDCPAARVESIQFPRVRSNRIAIYASAMGVRLRRLKKSGITPRYFVSEAENRIAQEWLASINLQGLPVVGIQPYSTDTYKNWPHVEELVKELSKNAMVLVFHGEVFAGFEGPNIQKIIRPIRESFALAAQCKVLVAPDSSLVHLGAALGIPTVGIYGPTSGRVFTKYYKQTKLVIPERSKFACSPCWRNEMRPCGLTGERESVCLRHTSVQEVLKAIDRPLPNWYERLTDWVRHIYW